MRPSALRPTVTSWICLRSWVEPMKCSRRSSVHLTGMPEPVGGERDEDLLGIELDHLDAEAAADVGRHDLHLLEAEAEQQAEPGADAGRGLRRVVDQQRALLVEAGDDRAALERHRRAALDHEAPVGTRGRPSASAASTSPCSSRHAADHVVGPVRVHERRVRRGGALEVGGHRQRLVVDADALRRRPRRRSGRGRRPSRSSRRRSGPRRARARTGCGGRRSPRAG